MDENPGNTSEPNAMPDPQALEDLRLRRWTSAGSDVPESFTNDQILRAIAGYSRVQAEAAKTTAGWVTFIGLVVLVQVVIVALVIFGAITVETTTGF